MSISFAVLGDRALLLSFAESTSCLADQQGIDEELNDRVHAVAARIRAARLPGIVDLVPAYASLAIHYDPLAWATGGSWPDDVLEATLKQLLAEDIEIDSRARRSVEIPVLYGGEAGPDLEEVSRYCRLDSAEVVRRHAAGSYRVYMLGFTPGFAYLGGMDPGLATPRRTTPRSKVEAGSVGIAGQQTGIYSLNSPGGWQIVGRTPLSLFDPTRTPPCLLEPGDNVRFVPVDARRFADCLRAVVGASGAAFSSMSTSTNCRARPQSERRCREALAIEVESPGLLTTVQDLGCAGFQHLGVGPAGAADDFSIRLANLLAGNQPNAPVLEINLAGPRLRFPADIAIALCGADLAATLDDQPVPLWRSLLVRAGSVLSFGGARLGARTYLAVAGGLAIDRKLGSASTHLVACFGGWHGRPLRTGDLIPIASVDLGRLRDREQLQRSGAAPFVAQNRLVAWQRELSFARPAKLRFIPGPEWPILRKESSSALLEGSFVVGRRSNRMGLRLEGLELVTCERLEMVSGPVATGTIQLPPDGIPILLLADRQTTGGYPRLGEIISVDLPVAAQLRPGEALCLRPVEIHHAQALYLARERRLARLACAIGDQIPGAPFASSESVAVASQRAQRSTCWLGLRRR
ncbi:MAG: 5-oxoprolinase subunit PxpB [Pseudomonadota bacterium]